ALILRETFDNEAPRSLRQFVHLDFDLVQSSCGFGVPFFDFVEDRPTMDKWVEAKSDEELVQYQRDKNITSMDGFPTGLFD
ncbi:MAG: pyridoxamine 5'-phosphate oxidase family protein, partial [Cohaesibacteraceae bacterium]|nr:pyridoxamine 5'-phosphate oxidase family protein [Cohaesibacteraceae bacterium]